MISIEMCLRLEENNLDLYARGSNEMLLKGVKRVGIFKTKNLIEKKTSRKITKMSFLKKMARKENVWTVCL